MADFLFGGAPNPDVVTNQTVNTSLPSWLQSYYSQLLNTASSVANQPYQPYSGQRIAGFTPDQTSAFQDIEGLTSAYQPTLNAGIGSVTSASNPSLDPSVFNSYMSPYLQNVTDRIAELGNRNLTENILPAVNATFTGNGQFGSSRNADFEARAIRDTQDSILGAQANALEQGYNAALQGAQEGEGRQLAAGMDLGQLAGTGQTLGLQGAAALENVGQTQQQLNQQNLDTAYQDFLNQRDYPRQNVSFLNDAVHGISAPASSDVTGTAPATTSQMAPSGLAQIVGAGIGSYGLGKTLGLFAKGGRVAKSVPFMGRRGPSTLPRRGIGYATMGRGKERTLGNMGSPAMAAPDAGIPQQPQPYKNGGAAGIGTYRMAA